MRNDNGVITFWIERNVDYRKPTLWNGWNIFSRWRSATFLVWWDNTLKFDWFPYGNGFRPTVHEEELIATGRWLSEAIIQMEKKMTPFLRNRYHVRSTKYAPSSSQQRIVETKIAVFRPLVPTPSKEN